MQNGFPHYDRTTVDTLFSKFTTELEEIRFAHPEVLVYSKESAHLSRRYIEELKTMLAETAFPDTVQEIHFFKHLKPLFSSTLMYYSDLYHLELRRPQGSKQKLEDFYMEEYDRIHLFFGMHNDFHKYCKSESTRLDEIYFIRGNIQHSFALHYAELDSNFSTGYDLLVARFRANDMLSDYLAREVERLHESPESKARLKSEFTWTAPISAFAELIVALDAYVVFNNAPIGIGKLCAYFSALFNLDHINIHKKYEEIRIRKKNRTVFLDALKSSLIRKMELDDENAL